LEARQNVATSIQIIALLTCCRWPGDLITLTAFVRIVIVLSFLRQAVGTEQPPPSRRLAALFLPSS
jgi:flagellar biosynthetic protein FliP